MFSLVSTYKSKPKTLSLYRICTDYALLKCNFLSDIIMRHNIKRFIGGRIKWYIRHKEHAVHRLFMK